MTTSNRWQEIDRIFAEVLDREPAARRGFLDDACNGDVELRQEVESLLAHDLPESLVDVAAVEEATQLLGEAKLESVPHNKIGPYQILRALGAGGMGRVYLAQDTRLNRLIAIKLLSEYKADAAERMGRFRQEALAASALNHPNILTIYEIGEFNGNSFIATEFVDGQTLRALMKTSPPSLELAVDIAIQVASALAAAHANGIIHRDIKPDNIMVRADGLVKVLDFGIAKFTETKGHEQQDLVETVPGAIVGTAAYMSPEQARGSAVDTRTDIWSLGAILYELAVQRRPFSGATPMDLIAAVLEREPPPIVTHGWFALEELQRIVSKALKKDREERYQTAAELLGELKQLKQKLETSDPAQSVSPGQVKSEGGTIQLPLKAKTAVVAEPRATSEEGDSTSSTAEYIVTRIKYHKRSVVVAALVLLVAAAGLLAYRSLLSKKSRPIESIAVMPFVNESGNEEVEYLSDGMTDSLINSLSQLPHLAVKARSSVFRYKGKEMEPQRVASELSVEAVLNGRVVQRGDNLTLYLSLVDARTGNQMWGEQYNRKLTDIVALQQEIALNVSNKLRAKLTGADEQKVSKNYTANPEAYKLYLKGRYHILKLTPAESQTSISYFQQAIEIDPNYALAYAGLSDAYRSLTIPGDMPPTEFLPKAKAAAQKAIDIDETLSESHTALGVAMFWGDWDWAAVENHYKRALELNPNSADAHLYYAHLLSNLGRHAEAFAEVSIARDLDPVNLRINALGALFLIHAGRTDEALSWLRKTFELDPKFWLAHSIASSAYIEKGMYAEAVNEARLARELFDGNSHTSAFQGYALAKWGKQAEARALLGELLTLSPDRNVTPYDLALIYNGLNERDKALTWLERAFEKRSPRLVFLKVEPKWNNLRDDPRFKDIISHMGL